MYVYLYIISFRLLPTMNRAKQFSKIDYDLEEVLNHELLFRLVNLLIATLLRLSLE